MQYMRIKTDTNGTLDDVQVASAQKDGANNVIADTYAKTNGNYPNMTAGNATKATQDGNGNNIAETYAKQNGSYQNLNVGYAMTAEIATQSIQDSLGNNIFNTYLGRWTTNTTKNGTTSRDFNAYTETGVYELIADANNAFTNNPLSIYNSTTTNGNWFLIVLKRDSNYITQIAVSVRADLAISIRNCSNGSWGEWKQLSEFGMNVRHSIDINNQSYGRFPYNGQSYTINKDATNVNDWWFRIGASGNVITVGISFQPKITLNKGTRYRIAYGLPNNQQNESGWWIIADANGAAQGGIEIDQSGTLYFTPYSENIATSTYMEGGAAYITNE